MNYTYSKGSFGIQFNDKSGNKGLGAYIGISKLISNENHQIWGLKNTFLLGLGDGSFHYENGSNIFQDKPIGKYANIIFEHNKDLGTLSIKLDNKPMELAYSSQDLKCGDWYPTVQFYFRDQSAKFLNPGEYDASSAGKKPLTPEEQEILDLKAQIAELKQTNRDLVEQNNQLKHRSLDPSSMFA